MENIDQPHADYAKVLFCDLFGDPLGCRFEITDAVHEDPWDRIGLYRVGQGKPKECLSYKRLCDTICEEDGKRLRCTFQAQELPELEDGFYQFLYINRDEEVCGASTPFEIKEERDSSEDDVIAEDDGDFMVVHSEKERRIKIEREEKNKLLCEKEDLIEHLNQELQDLREELRIEKTTAVLTNESVVNLKKELLEKYNLADGLLAARNRLSDDKEQLQKILKRKDRTIAVEIPALLQDKQILLQQLEDSQTMIKALEDSKLLALKEMNELTKVLEEKTHEVCNLKESLEDSRAKYFKTSAEVTNLKTTLDDSQAKYDEKVSEVSNLKAMLDDSQAKYEEKDNEVSDIKANLEDLKTKYDEKVSEVLNLKKDLEVFRTEYDKKASEVSNLKASLNDSQAKYNELNEKMESLTKLSVKSSSAATNQKPLNVKDFEEVSNEHLILSHILDDEIITNPKHKKLFTELKCERLAMLFKLEDVIADNIKKTAEISELQASLKDSKKIIFELNDDVQKLRNKLLESEFSKDNVRSDFTENHEESKKQQVVKEVQTAGASNISEQEESDVDNDAKIAIQERIIEELKFLLRNLLTEENVEFLAENQSCELESSVIRGLLDEKAKEIEKIVDKNINFQSSCMQLNDMVADLQSYCADLRSTIEEKEVAISKFKEDCLKKQAVIDYLTAEKSEMQKSYVMLFEEVSDLKSRLKNAAELYKKQYIEIKKLKKKLHQAQDAVENADILSKSSCTMSDSFSEDRIKLLETFEQCAAGVAELPCSQNSDSDTGEHVLGNMSKVSESEEIKDEASCSSSSSDSQNHILDSNIQPSASTVPSRGFYPPLFAEESNSKQEQLPCLRKMIEKNLQGFKFPVANPALTEQDLLRVPCGLCEKKFLPDILVKHMEDTHSQRICPLCGKPFDMKLPMKYFLFHVEDHFKMK